MRIMGIDPGFATVGIGVIDVENGAYTPVEWLTVETPSGMPFPERLLEIKGDILTLLEEFKPELVVVEKLFFATNEQTALDVAHARGVIVCCIADMAIPLLEATPLQLKAGITGDGKADKRQMQDMIARMLNLEEIPKPDDAADALCLAVYGALTERTAAFDGMR